MAKQVLSFTVNDEPAEVLARPYETLLDVLREGLGLTGPKEGCGTGDCGACTVHLDGEPVASCLMLAYPGAGPQRAHDRGTREEGVLHPLQDAFVRHGVPQCGFCIPGVLMAAAAVIAEHPEPTPEEIRYGIAGNLCRCTGYTKMITAITEAAAAARLAEGKATMATMKTTRDVKGVGLAIPRADGAEKVTGKVEYVADMQPKGLLHAKLLRSPHAHARIKRIDTSRAKALPGVRAVITAADIPQLKKKAPRAPTPCSPSTAWCSSSQPVAAVAADELAIAEEALDLIEVEYEVLPAAIDPLKSMQPGAPRRGRGRHRGRHERGHGPRRGGGGQDRRGRAGQGGQRVAAEQARARRRRRGLRRLRRGPREDLPRADGPPGLPRAARGAGAVGPDRLPHALGEHAGLVQHALGGRRTSSRSPRARSR